MKKILHLLIYLFILAVFSAVYIFTYNIAEPKAYDFMTKNVLVNRLPFDNHKQIYGNDNVVLVVIDEKSAIKYRWPWKRENYCKIFEFLNIYAHPKAIIFDGVVEAEDIDNPDSDKKFFNCVNKIDNLIVGFIPNLMDWEDNNAGKIYDKKFLDKYGINVEDKTSFSSVLYRSLLKFPDKYFNVVKNTGSVSMVPGAISGNLRFGIDEIYRTHEYLLKYHNGFLPSMAFRCFLMLNNYPKTVLTNDVIYFPELNYKINYTKTAYQNIVPVRYYHFYSSGYSHLKYSALDVMNAYDSLQQGKQCALNPEEFKNKVVIIGANVPAGAGINDNKNSPIINNHPGVDYQACALDNILNNDFLKVIPQYYNIILTILCSLLLYIFIRISNLSKSILSIFGVLLGYILLSATCFYFKVVINVLTPLVIFILTTIVAYTRKFVIEQQNKEKVKNAMGKYMSDDVMKNIVKNIDNLGLGGKKATVTVLFADIRGFTALSEQMTAQEVSELLNEYFTEMEPIITSYNGIINKFIGDAVMAIFGEPIQDQNHAQNAVKCACKMLERVQELNKKWEKDDKPKIEIGIGINTGEVFVGNIGSINRMEYTVIGDTVNLASRLESYNKTCKTKLLISEHTFERVESIIDFRKIEDVQIRGKVDKMNIYEVLSIKQI